MSRKFGMFSETATEVAVINAGGCEMHYGYDIDGTDTHVIQSWVNADGEWSTVDMYLANSKEIDTLMAVLAAAKSAHEKV